MGISEGGGVGGACMNGFFVLSAIPSIKALAQGQTQGTLDTVLNAGNVAMGAFSLYGLTQYFMNKSKTDEKDANSSNENQERHQNSNKETHRNVLGEIPANVDRVRPENSTTDEKDENQKTTTKGTKKTNRDASEIRNNNFGHLGDTKRLVNHSTRVK